MTSRPFALVMTEQQALEWHARAQRDQDQGRHQRAESRLARVARYFESADGIESPDLANVLADQAESLLALCRYREAEQSARRAREIVLAISDRLEAESRAKLAPTVYSVWGRALQALGKYEQAEVPLREAIRIAELAFGDRHPDLAGHLNNYGVLCKYRRRFQEGEAVYRRALRIFTTEFGERCLQAATVYHNLAGLEHSRRNFAKGEPLARLAYEIRRTALGDDHLETVADAVAWAGLLDGLGRYGESEPIYRRALDIYESRLGPDHFEVAVVLNNLGAVRAAQGQEAEARRLLARCAGIKRKLFGPRHPEVRRTEAHLEALSDSSAHNSRIVAGRRR